MPLCAQCCNCTSIKIWEILKDETKEIYMWICKYSNSLFSIVNKSRTVWDKHTVKSNMPLLIRMLNLCLFEEMLGWSLGLQGRLRTHQSIFSLCTKHPHALLHLAISLSTAKLSSFSDEYGESLFYPLPPTFLWCSRTSSQSSHGQKMLWGSYTISVLFISWSIKWDNKNKLMHKQNCLSPGSLCRTSENRPQFDASMVWQFHLPWQMGKAVNFP